jgi:hydroxymethylpyrimidine pyrophosphatase-like HAD family hydrolase
VQCALIFYGLQERFALRSDLDFIVKHSRTRVLPITLDGWEALDTPVAKALVIGGEAAIGTVRKRLAVESHFHCTTSYSDYLEINTDGVDKGTAIDHLLTRSGRSWRDVAVFADGENDLSMFRRAALKIAMAHAHERLAARADYVLSPASQTLGEILGYALCIERE